jgi:hypothetical protein
LHLKEWFTNNHKRPKKKFKKYFLYFLNALKRGGKGEEKDIIKMHLIKSGLFVLMSNFKQNSRGQFGFIGRMSFVLSSSRPIARRPTDGRTDGRRSVVVAFLSRVPRNKTRSS